MKRTTKRQYEGTLDCLAPEAEGGVNECGAVGREGENSFRSNGRVAGLNPLPRRIEWLTAEAAATYLGLPTAQALYQAVRRGQVPVSRLGKRRLRFSRSELDLLLGAGRNCGRSGTL